MPGQMYIQIKQSAVPVLQKTGCPGTSASAEPVPAVTTSRIIVRSAAIAPALSGALPVGNGAGTPGGSSLKSFGLHVVTARHGGRGARERDRADHGLALPERGRGGLDRCHVGRHPAGEDVGAECPLGADAERLRSLVQPVAAELRCELGERGVAGLGEVVAERHRAELEVPELWNLLPSTVKVFGRRTMPRPTALAP